MTNGSDSPDGAVLSAIFDRRPHLFAWIGLVLGAGLMVEGLFVAVSGRSVPNEYKLAISISFLAVAALLFGGYFLIDRLAPARYYLLGRWFAGGIVVVAVLAIPLYFQSASRSVFGLVTTVSFVISVGGGVGFVIGYFHASAVQRGFEAGRAERRADETRRERDRLDEFASVVSHDLRNPLTVAKGRLELAEADGNSEHLAQVGTALERMEAIIEDVLVLARAGEHIEAVDSVGLARCAAASWETTETRDSQLQIETDQTITADESRLQQLLENLFRNAVEHGGEGVTVRIGPLDDGFFVEDDGPGIPPDERARVFDSGYSTRTDGTGFGLSIVRQIADAHGWDVRVTEATEGGARFEFRGVEGDST